MRLGWSWIFCRRIPILRLGLSIGMARGMEDIVFSVHYLPGIGGNQCIDYTPATFDSRLIRYYGSMDQVAEEYYNHVERAIEWASGLPGRKRIGHINLIEKFRLELPQLDEALVERRLRGILPKLEAAGAGVDVNTAGFRKPTCGKAYVRSGSCRNACSAASRSYLDRILTSRQKWARDGIGTKPR